MTSNSSQSGLIYISIDEFKEIVSSTVNNSIAAYYSNNNNPNEEVVFMTRREIAKYVKKTPQTISDWVNYEGFPKPIKKIGRENLWLKSEVNSFLINRK